jgi:2-polyprenyl-6-methoxyphenol hydroxylase-like FAD-dependent oxidoreductase
VGLTLAGELARYGVPVRIVDKAAARSDKSKALVIWSRTLELLRRDADAETFVAAGLKATGANIIAGDKSIGRVGFGDVESPFPFALILPQSETERLLEAYLTTRGVAVERQVELISFDDPAHGVVATLRHADGSEERVETPWLVGCDGAHSTVRHILRLPFDGETLPSDWILADTHLAGLQLPADELGIYWNPEGVLALFPIAPGRYRIIADVGDGTGSQPGDPTLAEVQALVERRGPHGLVLSEPAWLSAFRINERKVTDYRVGRVFLAGDAAHIHSPAGGQGMNTGMQDAFNLAWKLALVCHGACPADPLLASYSAEREAVGAKVLADASRLTAMAVLRNSAAQATRNLVGSWMFGLLPVRRAMADALAEVSIGYPKSPLNGDAAHGVKGPVPGQRLPPSETRTPAGAGPRPMFALFAHPGEESDRLIAGQPYLLDPMLRAPPGDGGLWLVRPDGYVAMSARVGDGAEIDSYLSALALDI